MGQTYAGPEDVLRFEGGETTGIEAAVEDVAAAGIPSLTRLDEDGIGLPKYPCGFALNFSLHAAQQK
jgi:hypothetical protein